MRHARLALLEHKRIDQILARKRNRDARPNPFKRSPCASGAVFFDAIDHIAALELRTEHRAAVNHLAAHERRGHIDNDRRVGRRKPFLGRRILHALDRVKQPQGILNTLRRHACARRLLRDPRRCGSGPGGCLGIARDSACVAGLPGHLLRCSIEQPPFAAHGQNFALGGPALARRAPGCSCIQIGEKLDKGHALLCGHDEIRELKETHLEHCKLNPVAPSGIVLKHLLGQGLALRIDNVRQQHSNHAPCKHNVLLAMDGAVRLLEQQAPEPVETSADRVVLAECDAVPHVLHVSFLGHGLDRACKCEIKQRLCLRQCGHHAALEGFHVAGAFAKQHERLEGRHCAFSAHIHVFLDTLCALELAARDHLVHGAAGVLALDHTVCLGRVCKHQTPRERPGKVAQCKRVPNEGIRRSPRPRRHNTESSSAASAAHFFFLCFFLLSFFLFISS
eukprot:comp22237_c1_seq1/m.52696 comp22237_c1_seq1/g.52696  ORF comp22237_c1_seq1/g.52696 comp22237_c1_seq1/m.52696 type:complete len:450 (+) comp22237_c1_seq1:1882-3231(+)